MTLAKLAKAYQARYIAGKGLKTANEFKWRVRPLLKRFAEMRIDKIRTGD